MKPRKSQITLLIILGLVIFIIVSLVLYLSKSTVKKQSQQNIMTTQETDLDTQPIKEFVAKCLDKSAKDAVVLLGQQGGYIYASQGGPIIDYLGTDEGLFFVNYHGINIAYNIMPPKFTLPPYFSTIPEYPWVAFPYKTPSSSAEVFTGFFGINNAPPLTPSGGPNSIQTQIESYIDKNMAKCIDLREFKKQFDIAIGPSNTSVSIGARDVSVKSKIPITITNPTTKETTKLADFSTSMDIRLKDVYYFVKELINNDIKNIRFNIGDASNSRDSIRVNIIRDVFSNDDLITITDEKSLINGKPLEYVFARRNRPPALYFIRDNVLEFPQDYEIRLNDLLQSSELKAEDPDEDSYTFDVTPALPYRLRIPQANFKVEVNDGRVSDYKMITVKRI